MKKLGVAFFGCLLVGCAAHYPYAGDLATAEQAISKARPEENTYLFAEARGTTWVRYRVVYGPVSDYVTNGTALLRVAHGKVSISGPDRAQATIKRVLDLK
jgi:hypothetical protein